MADTKVVKSTSEEATRGSREPSLFGRRGLFGPTIPFGDLFGVNPFALMQEFSKEMDRAFSGSFSGGSLPEAWMPAIELKKAGGNLVISAELPGLKAEEVKVEITGDAVTIEGERKQEKKEEKEGVYRSERSYGRFYRSIPLPDGANPDQVKAEMNNGVLEIKIPISEAKPKSREIPVTRIEDTKEQEKKTAG